MAEGDGFNSPSEFNTLADKDSTPGPVGYQGVTREVYTPKGRTADIILPEFDGLKCHVAWRDEAGRKVPYSPHTGRRASGPHSEWGGTYKAASALAKRLGGHVGIVLGTPIDGYRLAGIDLDSCRDPDLGTIAPWARRIIDRFVTYWEVSPKPRVSIASTGSTARKGWACAGERGANGPLACVRPFLSRRGPMQGGRLISCMTRWPMAGGSGS